MTDDRAHHAWDRARARRQSEPEHVEYTGPNAFTAFFDGWHAREDAATLRYPRDADIVDDMIAAAQARAERSHQQSLDMMMRSRERERRVEALESAMEADGKNPADAPLYRRISMQRREIKRLTAENAAHHTASPANTTLVAELIFLPTYVNGTIRGELVPLADFTRERIAKALTAAAKTIAELTAAAEAVKAQQLNPPAGWAMFGTHVGYDGAVEFWGVDPEDGMPIWERAAAAGTTPSTV